MSDFLSGLNSFFQQVNPAIAAGADVAQAVGSNFAADPRVREQMMQRRQQMANVAQQRQDETIKQQLAESDRIGKSYYDMASEPNAGTAFAQDGVIYKHLLGWAQTRKEYLRLAGRDTSGVDQEVQAITDHAATVTRQAKAPTTVGGMMWDEQAGRFVPIPGYAEQQGAVSTSEGKAPATTGGMYWDKGQQKWIEIPGYTAQASAIASATRPATAPVPRSVEERDQETLIHGDPASPEYSMAYGRTFLTPKFVPGTDAQGRATVTPIYLPRPPGIRLPAGMATSGQGSPPPTDSGTGKTPTDQAATNAAPVVGAPIVTGAGKSKEETDAEARVKQLSSQAAAELPAITAGWGALSSWFSSVATQVGSAIPAAGRLLMSDKAQQAKHAIETVVQAYQASLARTSGGSTPMIDALTAQVMPMAGDKAGELAAKRERLEQWINALDIRAKSESRTGGAETTAAQAPVITHDEQGNRITAP